MIGISRQTISFRACAVICRILLVVLVVSGGTMACGGDADEQTDKDQQQMKGVSKAAGQRARYGNLSRDGFMVEPTDLNQDEEPDQWVFKDNVRTQRVERDLNFDGQVDLWQYPDAKGQVAEEEMDLDMDGRVDVVVYYDSGIITRKEMSVDFEGQFSIVKYYNKQGDLLRVERDEDGDQDIDVWEYYEKGQRVRVGWDEDSDGQPDRFDTFD